MAIVKRGSMLEGLRGRVGDLVFREVGGQTVVSRRPSGRKEDVRSPRRERALTRFQQAVLFAREARHRHSYRSLSRVLRAHSPYHVALQDYLSDPVIERVDDSAVGPSGGELVIEVSERVAVRSVRVKLATPPAAAQLPIAGLEVGKPPAPQAPPPAPEQRAAIPAALFFRRVQRPDRPEPGRQGGATIQPIHPAAPPAAAGPGEPGPVADAGAIEIHATRHLGIQQKIDRSDRRIAGVPRVEIWRATMPRPGEVEIIATDYAGNRAVQSVRAGLPTGEPD
jgi:hypothetical protein